MRRHILSLEETREYLLLMAQFTLRLGYCKKEEYEALETMINKLSTKKAIENLYGWWTDYVMLNDLEKIKIVTYYLNFYKNLLP